MLPAGLHRRDLVPRVTKSAVLVVLRRERVARAHAHDALLDQRALAGGEELPLVERLARSPCRTRCRRPSSPRARPRARARPSRRATRRTDRPRIGSATCRDERRSGRARSGACAALRRALATATARGRPRRRPHRSRSPLDAKPHAPPRSRARRCRRSPSTPRRRCDPRGLVRALVATAVNARVGVGRARALGGVEGATEDGLEPRRRHRRGDGQRC